MRILAVLWTVCLVSFCRAGCCGWLGCGNKNKESEEPYEQVEQSQDTPGEAPNGTSPEDTLASQPDDTSLNPTETQEEASYTQVEQTEATPGEPPKETSDEQDSTTSQHNDPSSENVDSESENVPSDPGVIDVSKPDPSIYQSFDYSFYDNNVKLIVPRKDVPITKLTNDTAEVYTVPNGETLEFANVYLNKDKKPELVHLVLGFNDTIKETYFEIKNGKWEECTNYDDKLETLETSAVETPSQFSLDFSTTTKDDECTVFEVEILGVFTKHFYPKPGHIITWVKDGENDLWTSSASYPSDEDTSFDHCLSCIISTKGSNELLEMTVIVSRSREKKYFEKSGQEWKEIKKKEDFDEKLKEMRSAPSSQHAETPVETSEDPN